MNLAGALNLFWAASSAGVLAALAWSEIQRGVSQPARILQRTAAVLLIAVSLFPCVSVSDDLFRYSLLETDAGNHGRLGTPPPEDSRGRENLHLARVLQALDHVQISGVFIPAIAYTIFVTVRSAQPRPLEGQVDRRPGRAPPIPYPIG